MEVMYCNDVLNNYFANKNITGFIGEISDLDAIVSDIKVKPIKDSMKVKKIIKKNVDDFKLLGLSDDILSRKYKDLSYGEQKLMRLIYTCAERPSIVILNDFDLGFTSKMKSKISRYIKTVNASFNINFIIVTNDILFVNKNAKHIIISKGKIIKYQGDIITAIKQNLIAKPPIIEFIDMANQKGADLEYTLDSKELLKAIYRSVF